jgi:hypothetical protein
MSIYDQDHNTIQKQLTPPDKRSTTMLAWERCLVKPIQWLHDLFFIDYAQGNTSSQYNPATLYTVGNRVQYNDSVYEVWQNPPTVGIDPTNINYWILIQDDFIGADERVTFNSQVLTFEFLLNKEFRTTFNQPNYAAPVHSDIWIENARIKDGSFIVHPNSGAESFIRPNSYSVSFIRPNHSFSSVNFIVHYPISVIPDNSDQLNKLKTLVEKFKLAGTVAGYQSY